MKPGIITIIVVLIAVIIAGFLIFSGNNDSLEVNENVGSQDNSPSNQNEPQETVTSQEQSQPQAHTIDISGFAYFEETLYIKQGDTVVWTNQDSARHTVTSDSASPGRELDSDLLSKGQSYSHTFTSKGTFDYHCTPHPYMKGKIIVE